MNPERASQTQTHPSRTGADVWWWGICGLTLAFGAVAGSVITAWSLSSSVSMEITHDAGAHVSVVEIDGILNGALTGRMSGSVLMTAGDKPVIPDANGSFSIRDSSVLTNVVQIDVPDGMRFVASRRGKKYYPVDSADGQRIVPENRVYFPDEADAQRAGFIR